MTKKIETVIHKANGGNHSPVNYRKARQMLYPHPYKNGYLYHLVFTGSEDRKVYRKAVELLCKELRTKGMPCRYKACYERDKFKRFHKHVFLLIEACNFKPDTIIHYRKGHWFTEMMAGLGLGFKIAKPKDPIHHVAGEQVNYAYVPKKAGPKLDDCLLWISYLTKVRSKEGVEGQIYTGSTNREPKPDSPIAALPAAKEAISNKAVEKPVVVTDCAPQNRGAQSYLDYPIKSASTSSQSFSVNAEKASNTNAQIGDKMTPAEKYIASHYEAAVDQQLDMEALRLYLLSHGVKRTPAQVVHELEVVFGFWGYASSHPAAPKADVAKLDALIDRTPLKARTRICLDYSISRRQ
jgi:hypothetical protein